MPSSEIRSGGKHMKKRLFSILLTVCLVLSLAALPAFAAGEYDGKTVILHTNDVHGSITGYAKLAAVKADYEAKGAKVLLVDAGDFSQGSAYVSVSKGADAIEMMNAVGYDFVTLGNHEFDYGAAQAQSNLSKFKGKVLCANVLGADGKLLYDASAIKDLGDVKVGFFGLETPEAQTKANPALIKGLSFLAGDKMKAAAQKEVDTLKSNGADVVIGIVHLGVDASSEPNTSYDLYKALTNVDFIIDGHSHTVMTNYGEEKLPIQSTGTAFANIGVIVIDNTTKKIEKNELLDMKKYEGGSDAAVEAEANKIIARIDAEFGAVVAKSEVELNGDKAPGNRTEETNLGDLITDAMMWKIKSTVELTVPEENVVALTNGGGIRAWLHKGDLTKKDVNTVLPFGNSLAIVYVSGQQLLEALEASTQALPESLGGFPQVAGIKFTVYTKPTYDKADTEYPGSSYFGPKTIQRVRITEVNGKPFDKNAKYAVITNNFVAAGGDTYYAFASSTEQLDTGILLDEVLVEYITDKLGGVVGEEYAAPLGRITIDNENDPPKETPPTSDELSVFFWSIMALTALAGAAVCIKKKKVND